MLAHGEDMFESVPGINGNIRCSMKIWQTVLLNARFCCWWRGCHRWNHAASTERNAQNSMLFLCGC